jgi:hypothetical protein
MNMNINSIEAVRLRAGYNTNFHCCGRTGEIGTTPNETAFGDDVIQTFKADLHHIK